jgi:TonB family protein
VTCIDCSAEYPSVLNGEEGTARVRVVVDSNGNVVDSQILESGGSSQLNQEAVKAARKMKFRVPGGRNRYTVKLPISFTIKGSDFDRQARQSQAQNQRERQQREQERQAQRERERQGQERQAQLERERQQREQDRQAQQEQERQAQQEREQQERDRQAQQEREQQERDRQAQQEREQQERDRQAQQDKGPPPTPIP